MIWCLMIPLGTCLWILQCVFSISLLTWPVWVVIDWQTKHYNTGISSTHTPAFFWSFVLQVCCAYCGMLAVLLYKIQIIAVSSVTNPFMLFMWLIVLFVQADDEQKRTVKKLIYAAKVRDFKKLVGGRGKNRGNICNCSGNTSCRVQHLLMFN